MRRAVESTCECLNGISGTSNGGMGGGIRVVGEDGGEGQGEDREEEGEEGREEVGVGEEGGAGVRLQ